MGTARVLIAVGVVIGTGIAVAHLQADPAASLCEHGRPAHRSEHVTYGGLRIVPGYVRDHVIPLCLGGPDAVDNMQYQTYADGEAKDRREWQACEEYCRAPSRALLDQLRAQFKPD